MDADRDLFDERVVLQQSASLRVMVRALLRDEALADDVVQETWLTAMRSSRRPGFEPGAWLRGIARNVIRTMRRGDTRRARREIAAAAPEPHPGPAEGIAKVERLRELLEVVSELREPIREAIILRYLDGLMPRDIAARLSIPVETVKGRLHTGLRLLRESLDERHDGSRSEWHAAFASWVPDLAHAGAAGIATTAGALTVLAGGGLSMKTALAILTVFVTVAGLFWAVGKGGEHDTGSPPLAADEGQDVTPGVEDVVKPIAARREPQPIGARDFRAAEGVRLRGHVRGEDGVPIQHARIVVVPYDLPEVIDLSAADNPAGWPRTTRTDSAGAFTMDLRTEGPAVAVVAEARSHVPKTTTCSFGAAESPRADHSRTRRVHHGDGARARSEPDRERASLAPVDHRGRLGASRWHERCRRPLSH